MKKDLFIVWLYVAAALAAAYFLYNMQNRKKYYDYVNGLGFGAFWLDQMTTKELHDLYTYIHDYTQVGKLVDAGSPLDFRLIKISAKFPAILKYS
jgi:hypothetical protein